MAICLKCAGAGWTEQLRKDKFGNERRRRTVSEMAICLKCAGAGWTEQLRKDKFGNEVGVAVRCECNPVKPRKVYPVLTPEDEKELEAKASWGSQALAAIPFYPKELEAKAEIAKQLTRMCWNQEQVEWVVRKAIQLLVRNSNGTGGWPGVGVLREIFCSQGDPRDGQRANSEYFPEGIPSAKADRLQMEAARQALMLPAPAANPPEEGAAQSEDLQKLVATVADRKRIRLRRFDGLAPDDPVVKKLEQMGL
jgi:hypothetical protein